MYPPRCAADGPVMVKSVFLTQQHTPKTAQTKTQRISIVMAYGSQLYGCGNLAKKNSFLPRPKQQQHHISSSVMCLGRATSFARNIKARPRNAIAAAAAAVAPAAMKLCRNAPLTARKKIQNDDRPTDGSTRNKKKRQRDPPRDPIRIRVAIHIRSQKRRSCITAATNQRF